MTAAQALEITNRPEPLEQAIFKIESWINTMALTRNRTALWAISNIQDNKMIPDIIARLQSAGYLVENNGRELEIKW